MFWKRQRKFQWWDVPEGYTLILRRQYSVVVAHPTRLALYDEALRVLGMMEATMNRKDEVE